MRHVLTEIATCILWLLTTICLVAFLFMVAPSYAHEEDSENIVHLEDYIHSETNDLRYKVMELEARVESLEVWKEILMEDYLRVKAKAHVSYRAITEKEQQ